MDAASEREEARSRSQKVCVNVAYEDFAYTCHSEYISKSTVIGTIIIVY
jgi:hypothetical protein